MVECRDELRFALEPLAPFGIVGQQRREDLDRHLAVQPRIFGGEDFPHASPAKRSEDSVVFEGFWYRHAAIIA
jgi:hypothetical protein